jgi:hypothetical protein
MENSISSEYRVKRMRELLTLVFRSGNQTLYSEVKAQKLKPDIYLIFDPKGTLGTERTIGKEILK